MEEQINKTIFVTRDEISRMIDFCTNEGQSVTRDFMDWYVNDNAFFTKTGILICGDVINGSDKKFVVSFDFNNPDIPSFVMYDYVKQKPVCRYVMYRDDNLSMKDISVKISWIDLKFFMQPDSIFVSNETYEEVKKNYTASDDKDLDTMYRGMSQKRLKTKAKILEHKLEKVNLRIATFMAQQGVYFTYATMYYFAKNKAKEVVGTAKTDMIGEGKQITALYKYTGYVNINEAKIYKPVIKKGGPVREYGRHIEKWSVRGHYRKVGDKTIWIEPFEKGEGELEKRVYGTEKESEVNIIPKVFEVTRNVKEKQQIVQLVGNPRTDEELVTKITNPNPKIVLPEIIEIPAIKMVTSKPDIVLTSRIRTKEEQDKLYSPDRSKPGFWSKIFSFFNKLKFK